MAEIQMSNTLKEREGIKINVKPAGVRTVKREKSMSRRIGEAFISTDRGSIKEHVIFDVVIPAIKSAVVDVISDGVNMLLYGEKKGKKAKDGRTAYGSFWASSVTEERRRESSSTTQKSSMGRYLEAAWESKEEANDVLDCLIEIKESYPAVTVADFFSLINDPDNFPIESIHSKWGWKTLAGVEVVKVSGGLWGLSLPRPVHLD